MKFSVNIGGRDYAVVRESVLILGRELQEVSTEIHIISTFILVIFNICIYSIIK